MGNGIVPEESELKQTEPWYRRAGSWLRGIWRAVTEPLPDLEADRRRRARLLAQLLLFFFWLDLLYCGFVVLQALGAPRPWWRNPDFYYGATFLLVLALTYGLSRRGYDRLVAVLLIETLSVQTFMAATFNLLGLNPQYPADTTVLAYLVMPAILATILLPDSLSLVLIVLNLLGMLVFPFLFSQISLLDFIAGPFLIVLSTSGLLLVSSWYRRRLEAERRQSLISSELRYRTLFDGMPVGLYRTTPTGQVLDANPALLQMLGYLNLETLLAFHPEPFGIWDPNEHRLWRETLEEQGVVQGHEVQWLRYDGTPIWVRESTRAVRGADGQIIYYEGAVEDVTARRQAEQEVRQLLDRQLAVERLVVALSDYTDLEKIYRRLYENVHAWMDTDSFFISLYDRERRMIRAVYAVDEGQELDPRTLPELPFAPEGRGKQSQVIRTGQPLYVPDARATWQQHDTIYVVNGDGLVVQVDDPASADDELDVRSALHVPMKVYGEPIGVIQVQSHRLDAYTQADIDLLTALSGVAAVAVQNAQLVADLQRSNAALAQQIVEEQLAEAEIRRRAAQQEDLNTVIAAAATASDFQQLLETALASTLHALTLDLGVGWVRDCLVLHGATEILSPELVDLVRQTGPAELLQSLGVEDWQQVVTEPWVLLAPAMLKNGLRATLTVPILVAGQRIGGLSLLSVEPRSWTLEQITLAEAVGRQLGGAAERLQLLERMQRQAHQLQQIIDTVPAGMALLDARLDILLANPVAQEHLAVLCPSDAEGPLRGLSQSPLAELFVAPGSPLVRDFQVAGPPRRIFEVTTHPVIVNQAAENWVLLLREVTKERELQERIQQQEKLAVVGQMAAGIAHDFNNVISVIVLYAQMLSRKPYLAALDRERLLVILQQAGNAAHLIQQILDFSRRSVIEPAPLDLLPLLKEMVKMVERTLPETIRLELTYRSDEYLVNADPTRIQQVVMNLIVNARDAMPEGGKLRLILTRLQVRENEPPPLPELTPGGWVVFSVSDTGTGIPPEVQPHIFEPFFTTKSPDRGTGLGLAQVYGIVTQHGGYVGLKSAPGEGTTFDIYLPALPTVHGFRADTEPVALPEGQGELILLVEDDTAIRTAVASTLQALNYRVLLAANGRAGLEIFNMRRSEIALVISDLIMPEMGGAELVRALKQLVPAVKILMMTGYPQKGGTGSFSTLDLVGWLQKPVSVFELAQAVKRALEA